MESNSGAIPRSAADRELILRQLDHVLASKEFSAAHRLQSFLRFVVTEEINARGGQLKETLIATSVFGRSPDYDPRIDSIVRVEASKLRQRLGQYYAAEGASDLLRFSMPKGAYQPLIEVTQPEAQSTGPAAQVHWRAAFLVLFATGGFAAAWIWWKSMDLPALDPSKLTLSSFTEANAFSSSATLSPDGKYVYYASDRAGKGALNLWRQPIEGGIPVRLTNENFHHDMPTISADGRTLVFKVHQGAGALARIPADGGKPEVLSNSAGGRDPQFAPRGNSILFWVPSDEQTVDYGRVFIAQIEAKPAIAPRRLFGDFAHAANPRWSPKANRVLILGTWQSGVPDKEYDAWSLALEGQDPQGMPVKSGLFDALKKENLHPPLFLRPRVQVSSWTDDWLYVTIPVGEAVDLFRIRLRPESGRVEGPFQRLTFGTGAVTGPRVAHSGEVVFARHETSIDLYSIALPQAGQPSTDLLRLTSESGEIRRPAMHASGTQGVWEVFHMGRKREPWYFDLTSGTRRQLGADLKTIASHVLISPEASTAAFRVDEPGVQPIYSQPVNGGSSKKICANCGTPSDWTSDGRKIFYITGGKPAIIGLLDVASGKYGDCVEHPSYNLYGARARLNSKGDGWVLFYAENGPRTRQILVAPMDDFEPGPQESWIPITDGAHWDQSPAWAPDGRAIYFVHREDGQISIAAREFDVRSGRPIGAIWTVHNFQSRRQSLMTNTLLRGSDTLWAAGGRLFFTLETRSSDLWKINGLGRSR
jgi:Tol biopolymer transport system component